MLIKRTGFRSWPGAMLCLAPGGLGCWFFFNAEQLGTSYEALGSNLIGASAVALAVFLVETKRDRRFSEYAQQHALIMQVALSRDLSGVDLSGRDLTGLSFRNRTLKGANLEHAVLAGVDLSYADLSGANLRHANLQGAELNSADLRLADFGYAWMSHSRLILADCRGASFVKADMSKVVGAGANLSVLPAEEVAFLRGAGSQGSHWLPSPLPRVNSEAGQPATMSGTKLIGSQWTGANFKGANLTKADFRYSACGTDIFRNHHPGSRKLLWWVITRDDRQRAIGVPRFRPYISVDWVPANFADADTTEALFEHCTGPDLDFTNDQLASCKSPLAPRELRRSH